MTRSKKRKLKKRAIFYLLSLILIIGIVGLVINGQNSFAQPEPSPNKDQKDTHQQSTSPQNEVYKINLLATGDGLIHNAVFWTYDNKDGTYDFTGALSEVKDIIKKYDIAYYNQETPFGPKFVVSCTDKSGYCGYPRFNTPSEFGDAMIDAGFNMVSLATNHSIDAGEKGILSSSEYWKSQKNVLSNGIASSEEERNTFQIMEKNNITYTMLSYTTSTNGLSVPSGKGYLLNTYNAEQVKKDIEAVRDKVDVLIVAMHWGVEYASTPNSEQIKIANYLADLGVDIIIGNHPHVLQPITKINNTIVMYSLGNFISNQYGTDDYNKIIGFMATLDITKTVTPDNETTITIDNLGGELIFTKYNGNPITTANHDGHIVIPFSKMTDDSYLKDYERLYTKYTNVLKSMGTDLNITPLPTT